MANKEKIKQRNIAQRKGRVRAKISGTAKRPRLNVFRSLKYLYAQLIDDQKGVTVLSAKDTEIKDKKIKGIDLAFKVGELIAERAKKADIKEIVFDKSSYKYHGRVKSLAEGARKGGLKF